MESFSTPLDSFSTCFLSKFKVWEYFLRVFPDYSSENNKAKRFANQLLFDAINALANVYCYFLRAELNGYHQQKRKEKKLVFFC